MKIKEASLMELKTNSDVKGIITQEILDGLFEEEEQIDPPMIVPVFERKDGKFVLVDGKPVLKDYRIFYPRFLRRCDYFTGNWVILNPERAKRDKYEEGGKFPDIDFMQPYMYQFNPKDLAKFNGMSYEEIMKMLKIDPKFNKLGDITRLEDNGNLLAREFLNISPFLYYHSIITDFAYNNGHWDVEAFIRGLDIVAERTRKVRELGYKPVYFRNHGSKSGASQQTPHGQFGGLKKNPPRIRNEKNYAREFSEKYRVNGSPLHLHDAVYEAEKRRAESKGHEENRIIAENKYAVALCPWAPTVGTDEVRVLLKPDYKTFDALHEDKEAYRAFGELTANVLNAMQKSGIDSFNAALLQDDSPDYRISFLIAPSQNYGSMEKVYEMLIVEGLPERSAAMLRQNL